MYIVIPLSVHRGEARWYDTSEEADQYMLALLRDNVEAYKYVKCTFGTLTNLGYNMAPPYITWEETH